MEKLRDPLDRPIVLVGLMGAGKSTVGRRLAKRLGLPFVDSDSAIEDAAGGASAAEVFELYGEEDFRDGERRLVARLVDGERRVIATGGGAFVDPAERTGRRDTRPLLRGGDRSGTLARLDQERRPDYAEADIHVRSGAGDHGDVVDAIVAALRERFAPDPAA